MTYRTIASPWLAIAAFMLAAASASPSYAADLYWSANGSTQGGAGTWNTTDARWGTISFGPYGDIWDNADNDTAIFGWGGSAGTVTLGVPITTGGLRFNTTGYTIAAGTQGLTFNGNANVALYNIAAATITGNVTGTGSVTFTALNPLTAGTTTFSGISTGGWSGSTTINAGLTLTTTTTSGNVNHILNSTSAIAINGGTIQFNRATNAQLNAVSDTAPITVNGGGTFGATSADAGGASANETIGAVTVNSGQMNFNWTNGASSGAQMILSGLSRSGTAAVTFSGNLGSTGRWRITGAGTTAAGEIIGPWATTGGANGIGAQTDYAVYNGDFVAAAAIGASAQSAWSTDYTTGTGTLNNTLNNTNVTAAANGRLSASRNINSLRNITNSAAPSAVNSTDDFITMAGNDLQNGDVVAVRAVGGNTTGGLTAGQAYYVIDKDVYGAGTFRVATAPGGSAANLTTTNTGSVAAGLNLNGNVLGTYGILNGSSDQFSIGRTGGGSVTLPTTTSGNLYVINGNASVWVDAPITDNGPGVLTLVKGGSSGNGGGQVTLSGNNTYTGGTVVNAGAITLSGTNTFATGAAGADVINGGSITYSTLAAWGGTGRDVVFNGTGTLTSTVVGYSGGTLTSNAGANAVIANTNNGGAGSTQISFATTTGNGNIIYSAGQNRLLNLGNASTFNGTLQARLTGNANNGTSVNVQFSAMGDAAGSQIQFVGGTSDSQQAMTVAYAGTSALTFNNRQIQLLDRLTGNWEIRDNIIANNSSNAAHTWTINTDLLYTGGRPNTGNQTGRRFILSGSNAGDNAFNGAISNGTNPNGLLFEKAGAGKWILGGNNSYTGTTTVTAGTLEIGGTGRLGNGNYSSNISIASTNSGRLVYNSSASQTLGGVVSGAGALFVESGILTLTNNNTYTGATTVNGGTLVVEGSLAAGTAVTVNSGGTLAGSGLISGNVTANGSVAPGNSIGTLSIGGNLTWNAGDDWVFELGPGNTADLADITGAFTRGSGLDGDFVFDFDGSTATGTFVLVEFGSTDFDVAAFNYTGLGGSNTGTFNLTGSQLQFIAVPEPAALALAGLGIAGIASVIRRRGKASN
jgi:autotransporter-associated beta strand protein